MLQVVQSCIGTKYTSRFGTLMAVSSWLSWTADLESHVLPTTLYPAHTYALHSETAAYGVVQQPLTEVQPSAWPSC